MKLIQISHQKQNSLLKRISYFNLPFLALVLSLSLFNNSFSAQNAVPTFECIGLYWSPGVGSSSIACNVNYRISGTSEWKQALPLWFDSRNSEYRGSIVNLTPNTNYEIKLSLQNNSTTTTLNAKTWNEDFPIAKTIYLPAGVSSSTFTASESGTANGYVLYVASPSSSTIDVNSKQDFCINVQASYVIIRGVTCKNAKRDGITLGKNAHDVVIEQCDISGWGRIDTDGFGVELDAGVKAESGTNVQRIIVQYNKMHNPRSNSNNWNQLRTGSYSGYHPAGPSGVAFITSAGNNVIRYNEVYSNESHCFNDGISGSYNNTKQGFPGLNSDIYGNSVKNTCDDAIESDGGGCNVRIWGNYLDTTYAGISASPCSVGPIYVFRNVLAYSRRAPNSTEKGVFAKTGDQSAGVGKQYWFHNTILQPGSAAVGLSSSGSGSVTMVVSYNNIWNSRISIDASTNTTTNIFDYDLCSGDIRAYSGAEPHAIKGTPVFLNSNKNSGIYQLSSNSPGLDAGIKIPNFNDNFSGTGPDIGAHESGTSQMVFGPAALQKRSTAIMYHGSLMQKQSSFTESKKVISLENSSINNQENLRDNMIFDIQGRHVGGQLKNLSDKHIDASGIRIMKSKITK